MLPLEGKVAAPKEDLSWRGSVGQSVNREAE